MSLLSIGIDAKTSKGESLGYMTGVMYLAPASIAGVGNMCAFATKGCMVGCLYTSGRGVFTSVQTGRINRTRRFRADRYGYMRDLTREISALVRKAARASMTPLVRLNGTSDLPWENVAMEAGAPGSIMEAFPDVQFYDYTKNAARMRAFLAGRLPSNYHLTFSRSECNDHDAKDILARGGNVAVVFDTRKGETLPTTWNGYAVIDGDVSDVRVNDPRGVVVGLRAKGPAKRDKHGFVVAVR